MLRIWNLVELQSTAFIELEGFHLHTFDAVNLPITITEDLLERLSAVYNDALFQGGLNFPFMRGHLFTLFKACKLNLAAQANSAACAVDGHISAAEHQYPFS